MKTTHAFFLCLLSALWAHLLTAYSFDDYLKESQAHDPSLKASQMEYQAAELGMRKSEEITSIKFFSEDYFYDDTRPVANPNFQGKRTSEWNLSAGLNQANPWGLNWSITQNIKKTKIFGVPSGILPMTEYYDFYPTAELSIPLWRNLLGSEVRAQRDLLKASSSLQKTQALIERESKLVEVEKNYYRYGIQQNLFDLADKNLNRSEKLYDWIQGRRRKNLIDDSDEMQARAALSLRKLEFDRADRDLRTSLADFNSYREGTLQNSTEKPTKLAFELIEPSEFKKLAQTKKISLLEKLRKYQAEMQQFQARANSQSEIPKLDLKTSLTLQGRDDAFSDSYSDMKDKKRNRWAIAVSFLTPLDFTLTRDLRQSADLSEKAANERLLRSSIDQELSWIKEKEDLLRCSQSLELVRDLEDSQRKRFLSEEKKYKNGRSTLFMVLSAEQDLINAESQKWSNELQCRVIKAQTRLFTEGEG